LDFNRIIAQNPKGSLMAILLAGFLLYLPSLQFEFLINFDDDLVILNSQEFTQFNLTSVKYVFTHFKDGLYHPITSLSWMIEYQLFGFDAGWMHLTNILFHLANAVLVFLLIRKIAHSAVAALGSALLFVIHPMHVENIAWVTSRKDLMYAFFALLCLLKYLQFLRKPSPVSYFLALLFFIFSLLSKANAVPLPLLFLIFAWYEKQKLSVKDFLLTLPYFILSAILIYFTYQAQARTGYVQDFENVFTPVQRFLMLCYSLLHYGWNLLFPLDLQPKNFYPSVSADSLSLAYYLSLIGVAGLALLTWKWKKHRQLLLFGLLFYTAMLIPVLKIVPTGNDIVSNRYAYLPALGIYFILLKIFITYRKKHSWLNYLALLWLVLLAVKTYAYQYTFKDPVTVWSTIIEQNKDNQWALNMARTERGSVYLKQGKDELALADFKQVMESEIVIPRAYINQAKLLERKGNLAQARTTLEAAFTLAPENHEVQKMYGLLLAKTGELKQAEILLTKALQHGGETDAGIYNNRGIVYSMQGNYEAAIRDFEKTLEIDGYQHAALLNLGQAHYRLGNYAAARKAIDRIQEVGSKPTPALIALQTKVYLQTDSIRAFTQWLQLSPPEKDQLLSVLIQEEDHHIAIQLLSRQINEAPDNPKLYYRRAEIYLQSKNMKNAIADLQRSSQLMPQNAAILLKLAETQLKAGDQASACHHWKRIKHVKQVSSEALSVACD
jgi:Tfp pilus assembly protein PilF